MEMKTMSQESSPLIPSELYLVKLDVSFTLSDLMGLLQKVSNEENKIYWCVRSSREPGYYGTLMSVAPEPGMTTNYRIKKLNHNLYQFEREDPEVEPSETLVGLLNNLIVFLKSKKTTYLSHDSFIFLSQDKLITLKEKYSYPPTHDDVQVCNSNNCSC